MLFSAEKFLQSFCVVLLDEMEGIRKLFEQQDRAGQCDLAFNLPITSEVTGMKNLVHLFFIFYCCKDVILN